MDGDVGCYSIEAKVLLTISNASLSSGNRKFTNDPVSGFFHVSSEANNLANEHRTSLYGLLLADGIRSFLLLEDTQIGLHEFCENTVFAMLPVHFKFFCTHIPRNLKNCTLSITSLLALISGVWLS